MASRHTSGINSARVSPFFFVFARLVLRTFATASWLGHGEEKTLSIVRAVSGIVAAGELFRSRWYRKYGDERDVIELI